jgi:exonuclease SbcC
MIPQGEFKKLLVADSTDREKILQKLFDTTVYNKVMYKLDERAKRLFNDIKEIKNRRDQELSNVNCGNEEKLHDLLQCEHMDISEILLQITQLITNDTHLINTLTKEIDEKENKINQLIDFRTKSVIHNEAINTKEMTIKKIEEKQLQKEDIKKLEDLTKKAERTLVIIPVEKNFESRISELENKKEEADTVILNLKRTTEEQEESAQIIKDNQQILLQSMNTAVQYAQLDSDKISFKESKFNNFQYFLSIL